MGYNSVVEALHGSHMFCLSSHVIRNLNWKYTLLKFHQLDIVALTETWLRIVRTNTLLINVLLTDIPFIIHLTHLVGEGLEWVYW